jgi:head-tail adaptor
MAFQREDDLPAGTLIQRITLSGPIPGERNDEPGFAAIAEGVPAAKRALRGTEKLASGRDVSEQWVEWRIRWRAELDAAVKLTHGSSEYDIESIDDPTGNRRVLVIMARVVR